MLTRSRLVLVLLLGWLAWRGAAAAGAMGTELAAIEPSWLRAACTLSEEERIQHTLEQQDAALGLPRGYHGELYRALMQKVEPAGKILIARGKGTPKERNVGALAALIFPREFQPGLGKLSKQWTAPPGIYVLDFEDELRAVLAEHLQPLASGANWTLWH